jgi:type I restriction enzyme M protein
MTNPLTQQDVNNTAWAACDTFRGVIDPAQYKDYILVMLFLKYISDQWADHYAAYRKEYGDNEERIRRKLERERFILPYVEFKDEKTGEVTDRFLADFHALYERRKAANLGELINIVLDHIEEANKAKLEGVFRNIDFNSEANLGKTKDRNRRLENLLGDFAKLDLRPSRVSEDVIGNTYIYLIERFASDAGKKAGEFYTPKQVSKLLAQLAAPKPGDRICDPTCGSGGLLIEAAALVEAQGSRDFALFGQEVNGSTWALARMNMFLHGKDAARIEWGDTLNSPALVEADRLMRFNVVVANPPFSLDKWGAAEAQADRYNRFLARRATQVQGRLRVRHPHDRNRAAAGRARGRGGAARRAVPGRRRRPHPPRLIEENLLDAVIGLPGNLFPTTSIPVAILVFDRAREKGGARENCQDVLFIDASRDYQSGKNQNALLDEHMAKHARHLPRPPAGGQVRPRRQPAGDRRQRLQPQHPALRRHLRGRGRDRRRRRRAGDRAPGRRTGRGAPAHEAVPEGAGRMSGGELILYTAEDGSAAIQLRAEGGTVWLTQLEMATLFDTTKQNISLHIKNILPRGS